MYQINILYTLNLYIAILIIYPNKIKLKLNKVYMTMQMVKCNQNNLEKEQKTARLTPLAIKDFLFNQTV